VLITIRMSITNRHSPIVATVVVVAAAPAHEGRDEEHLFEAAPPWMNVMIVMRNPAALGGVDSA
jgi:hypothetical protein